MIKIKSMRKLFLPCVLTAFAAISGCNTDGIHKVVKIEYTDYGVPHITADNYKSLAFGIGVTHAQENMCTLAEQIVAVRSEKARVFGAGQGNLNVIDDFGVLALEVYQQAQSSFSDLSSEHQSVLQGYVDGFNQTVADKGGPQYYPSPCVDADWVPTVSAIDLHAYHMRLALMASGDNSSIRRAVAIAQPPSVEVVQKASPDLESLIARISHENTSLGSNGWALGSQKTESGNGMLLSNPHFPWVGNLRFVQSHLKIPGKLNVTGVGFVGIPGILIGFNDNVAWTHTVSQSKRMVMYNLTTNADNPTQYDYDGEYRDMVAKQHSIMVMQEDGTLAEQSTTLYSSHYGPIMYWTSATNAVTFRDANTNNTNLISQWLQMDEATSLSEFKQAFQDQQGVPWVNTIAVDKEGTAFYIDASRTAKLAPTADATIQSVLNSDNPAYLPVQTPWKGGDGQLVVDGADPLYEWVLDPSTHTPGVATYDDAPKLETDTYVFNANSSHWLTNVENPITGKSIVYGPEETARSMRTRMNAKMLTEVEADGASGLDGLFNLGELKNVMTNQRGITAELLLAELTERCAGKTDVLPTEGDSIDISAACTVLTNWNGRYALSAQGAHLFREFAREFSTGTERDLSQALFENEFVVAEPVSTPSGLAARAVDITDDEDPILVALADAVQTLDAANIDIDAYLYTIQGHPKNQIYPIPGGQGVDGVFNINTGPIVAFSAEASGYAVYHGASWVMAVEFTDQGPVADAWLTYSQSHDPDSDHYEDQTALFSAGQWRPVLFSDEDIAENVDLGKTLYLTTP